MHAYQLEEVLLMAITPVLSGCTAKIGSASMLIPIEHCSPGCGLFPSVSRRTLPSAGFHRHTIRKSWKTAH
jgi:hypothetical protein